MDAQQTHNATLLHRISAANGGYTGSPHDAAEEITQLRTQRDQEIAHLSDNTSEHCCALPPEEQYTAAEEDLEEAEAEAWAERNRERINAEREQWRAGERGASTAELRAEAEAEIA